MLEKFKIFPQAPTNKNIKNAFEICCTALKIKQLNFSVRPTVQIRDKTIITEN